LAATASTSASWRARARASLPASLKTGDAWLALRIHGVPGRAARLERKVLLTWEDGDCRGPLSARSRSTFQVNGSAWSRGLVVTGGGAGVVSHAGTVLVRQLADKTGLTEGLS
jgi:hypothetical protein